MTGYAELWQPAQLLPHLRSVFATAGADVLGSVNVSAVAALQCICLLLRRACANWAPEGMLAVLQGCSTGLRCFEDSIVMLVPAAAFDAICINHTRNTITLFNDLNRLRKCRCPE
jgi:hypothetical protein